MIPRPDELANQSQIDLENKFKGKLKGTGAVLAGAAVGALSPFLSKYIPLDLAVKGISKVSPRVGDFLKRGQSAGLNVSDGLDFIKSKFQESFEDVQPTEENNKNPQQNRGIVEQYSPELHQFILNEIQNGRSPLEAGAVAQLDKKGGFKKIIEKIVKDHKTPWSAIVESVYGNPQSAQSNVQPNQEGKTSGKWDQIASTLKDILNS